MRDSIRELLSPESREPRRPNRERRRATKELLLHHMAARSTLFISVRFVMKAIIRRREETLYLFAASCEFLTPGVSRSKRPNDRILAIVLPPRPARYIGAGSTLARRPRFYFVRKVPSSNSLNACRSSACVFITI